MVDSEEDDALQQDSTGLPAASPVQQFNRPTKEETSQTISFTEMLTSNHAIWQPEDFAYECECLQYRFLYEIYLVCVCVY